MFSAIRNREPISLILQVLQTDVHIQIIELEKIEGTAAHKHPSSYERAQPIQVKRQAGQLFFIYFI